MPEEISLKPIWYPGYQVPPQHVSYRIYPDPLRNQMMENNLEQIEVITQGRRKQVAQELKKVFGAGGKTPYEINEAAARIVWDFVENHKRLPNDTVAWACKAVGVSRSGRYHDLLYDAIQRGREISDGVAKHCRLVYDYVSDDSEAKQYVPGDDFKTEPVIENEEEEVADLSEIKEQLVVLRQLHSDGLIDKHTYELKRESILEDL